MGTVQNLVGIIQQERDSNRPVDLSLCVVSAPTNHHMFNGLSSDPKLSVTDKRRGKDPREPAYLVILGPIWEASRSVFLCCRFAPIGKRLTVPQRVHVMTRTSAQGFLLCLLSFAIVCDAVRPGMSAVRQVLQMDRLSSDESRT